MKNYLIKFFEPATEEKNVAIKAMIPAFISSTIGIISIIYVLY